MAVECSTPTAAGPGIVRPTRIGLRLAAGLVAALSIAGCSDGEDASPTDAGGPVDAGNPDVRDSGDPPDTRPDSTDSSEVDAPDPEDSSSIETLEVCDSTVPELFDPGDWNAPTENSDAYRPPARSDRTRLAESVTAALRRNFARARGRADRVDYAICRSPDAKIAVWAPDSPERGGARLAVRLASDTAPLVVEVPHPFFEFETLDEGLEIFQRAGARALLSAGTHRCANSATSRCDGETGVCSSTRQPFRRSDMAHVVASRFQVMHRRVTNFYETSLAISLHGFADDGISLSNGTTEPTTETAPVARLGDSLGAEFPDARITYCNDIPGRTRDTRLCGTTNVQGRSLNGADSACVAGASGATGRFIHLEQSRAIRRDFERAASAVDEFANTLP